MNEPKISVIIPLYNRKNYIEACILSVLTQNFQDFEIVIRDDCSTDGVFEFVKENFSSEISSGKIKLFRNFENLGEATTLKKLFEDATGKYVMILHNDDLYLQNALKYFFEVAEDFHADVVHSTGSLISAKDGIIEDGCTLKRFFHDFNNVENVELMPNDLNFRFNEWLSGGTFCDMQYNIFRRNFLIESKIVSETNDFDNCFSGLLWLMKAKIFVKTSEIFYIHRDSSDSQENDENFSPQKLERNISSQIKLFSQVDKFISSLDFFKNDDMADYIIKSKIFIAHENSDNDPLDMTGNKNYAELYKLIEMIENDNYAERYKLTESIFKKIFGSSGIYLAMLYHWGHIQQFKKNEAKKILFDCLETLQNDV